MRVALSTSWLTPLLQKLSLLVRYFWWNIVDHSSGPKLHFQLRSLSKKVEHMGFRYKISLQLLNFWLTVGVTEHCYHEWRTHRSDIHSSKFILLALIPHIYDVDRQMMRTKAQDRKEEGQQTLCGKNSLSHTRMPSGNSYCENIWMSHCLCSPQSGMKMYQFKNVLSGSVAIFRKPLWRRTLLCRKEH